MSDNLDIFKSVLDKFAFRHPVAEETQDMLLKHKQKAFAKTLKELGEYNIADGLILRAYFYTRRIGIRVSAAKLKILLGIISFIIGSVFFAGILFSLNLLRFDNNKDLYNESPHRLHEDKAGAKKTAVIRKTQKNQRRDDVNIRLGIETFTGSLVDNMTLNNITDTIAGELLKLKDSSRVIDLRQGRKGRNINLLLTGSIDQFGEKYIVTAKIIDVEKSSIVFTTNETVDSIKRINDACLKIARRVAGKIE